MDGAVYALLRLYLASFAFLAPDSASVRGEHALIEYSIRERCLELVAEGYGRWRASLLAWREHLPELSPWAIALKTLADTRCGSRRWSRSVRTYPLRLLAAATLSVAMGMLVATSFADSPTTTMAMVGGPDDEGAVAVAGKSDTLREAIYRTTGACLDESVTPDLLTDELLRNGSEGADCSDLDDPQAPED